MDGRKRTLATRLLQLALTAAIALPAPAVLCAQAPQPTESAPPAQAAPSIKSPDQNQSPDQTPRADAALPPAVDSHPIAIVPLDSKISGYAAEVTGAMHVYNGRAFIDGNGAVTSGAQTTHVTLPYRGTLLVCASTTVNLAADSNAPPGGMPGLLMALDHGAVEMSFANSPAGSNADVLMTPDFRILVAGPGASEVKVRLGPSGDTCIDNSGAPDDGSSSAGWNSGKDAPYVVVTSLFDTGVYRVQPGQRVMLQHGSLNEVVDQEKEPCGCPPPTKATSNEFPLAQSEGLEPLPPAPLPPTNPDQSSAPTQLVPPLVYSGGKQQQPAAVTTSQPLPAPAAAAPAPQPGPAAKKKPGVFTRLGHFFRRVFGAE